MRRDHAKMAVIVGAGSKVGRAIAVELAWRGFKVGIVDFGMDDAQSTLDMVREAGGTAEPYSCTMSNLEEVRAMACHFFEAWGEVGLLVNNVGADNCGARVCETPIGEWQEVINANLWGTVFACHAFIPRMIEQGGGHIANGTYGAGLALAKETAPHNIAKAAVTSYTNGLSSELAPCDITVSMLCSALANARHIDGWLKRAGFDIEVKELIRW